MPLERKYSRTPDEGFVLLPGEDFNEFRTNVFGVKVVDDQGSLNGPCYAVIGTYGPIDWPSHTVRILCLEPL